MAKCICGEDEGPDPHWRIKSQKPKGRGYQYLIVCLTCECEWWSTAQSAPHYPRLSQEERERLENPFKYMQSFQTKRDDSAGESPKPEE